jgi:hypothetical protein
MEYLLCCSVNELCVHLVVYLETSVLYSELGFASA